MLKGIFAGMALAVLLAPAALASGPRMEMAQAATSCSAMNGQCARRCREWNPQDKNCVADHCTPKLKTCRSDGCWQEGNLYGGRRVCGLAKS